MRDDDAVEPALRAGLALYGEGHVLAAHEPWERAWLDLDSKTPDGNLLQGLIQFVAAIHHAREGNVSGATGLADSAEGYLAAVPADHRGVDLRPVRDHLDLLATDPTTTTLRVGRPEVRIDGEAIGFEDLELAAVLLAAEALAESLDGSDGGGGGDGDGGGGGDGDGGGGVNPGVVADAVRYAREERGTGRSTYAGLLTSFLIEDDERRIVYARLKGHVERERRKEDDVDGLF